MSLEILANPAEAEAAHNILARDFTDRYTKRAHISAIAYGMPFDSANEYCDYTKTWWEAAPTPHSERIARAMMLPIFMMRAATRQRLFYEPIREKAKEIDDAMHEFNLMTITDHEPDLLAIIPVHGISHALAERRKGDHRQNLEDMYRLSHVVATRGFMPLKFGRREHPSQSNALTIVRAGRLICNPHFTFPRTPQMMSSGISPEFIKAYNQLARADAIEVANLESEHPEGLFQSWAMAPSGGPPKKVDNPLLKRGKMKVIQKVVPATTKTVQDMKCGILPFYYSPLAGSKVVELGKIIPPDEVGSDTLARIMERQAWFRRNNGEEVYYEGNLRMA